MSLEEAGGQLLMGVSPPASFVQSLAVYIPKGDEAGDLAGAGSLEGVRALLAQPREGCAPPPSSGTPRTSPKSTRPLLG